MDLSIFEYLENDIVERDLITPGDKMLAMVSGGRDSVFLLYFLEYLRKRGNIEVSVFHLNHMIRGKEAVRDEEFTGKLASRLGFPFYSKRVDVKKIVMDKRDNLESVARSIRYGEAEKIRVKLGYNLIVTAHTKTDFFETVIMHLLRGDSVYGLLGIAYKNGNVIRPILAVNREQVTAFLEENGIQWVDDSTNYEPVYTRNYIRNIIAPHFAKIGGNNFDSKIMNSVLVLRDYVKIANEYVNRKVKETVKIKNGKLHLDLMSFFHYNGVERRMIIVKILELLAVSHSRNMIYAVEGFISNKSSFYNYNNIFNIAKNREKAIFWKDSDYKYSLNLGEVLETKYFVLKTEYCKKCEPKKSKNCFYFDAKQIPFPVIVRKFKTGDKMVPFGMNTPKKVKDIFNGEKIPVWERDEYPLIVAGDEIIGIMGVKRSSLYLVNKKGDSAVFEYGRINEN